MAVDSASKRLSAVRLLTPGYTAIIPDGTIGASDRIAATWIYSGITVATAAGQYAIHWLARKYKIHFLARKYKIEQG